MVDKRSVGKIADTPTYRQNLGSLKTCDFYFISHWIGLYLPQHQQIMAAGGGNFQRPFDMLLVHDFGIVHFKTAVLFK